MDPVSGEITVAKLTHTSKGDIVAEEMLPAAHGHVKQVLGDGAYDSIGFREKIASKGATANILPPRNAVIGKTVDETTRIRNNAIKAITGLGGDSTARKLWKKLERYHIRSLVETTMFS